MFCTPNSVLVTAIISLDVSMEITYSKLHANVPNVEILSRDFSEKL
jgi:hypothetical protein